MLSHPRIMESEFIGMPFYKNDCETWKFRGWHKTGINSESLSVFFKDPGINHILFAMLVLPRKKTALKEMIRGKRAASEKCHWTKISWNLSWDAMPASWGIELALDLTAYYAVHSISWFSRLSKHAAFLSRNLPFVSFHKTKFQIFRKKCLISIVVREKEGIYFWIDEALNTTTKGLLGYFVGWVLCHHDMCGNIFIFAGSRSDNLTNAWFAADSFKQTIMWTWKLSYLINIRCVSRSRLMKSGLMLRDVP